MESEISIFKIFKPFGKLKNLMLGERSIQGLLR